jgi:hypothetical protein
MGRDFLTPAELRIRHVHTVQLVADALHRPAAKSQLLARVSSEGALCRPASDMCSAALASASRRPDRRTRCTGPDSNRQMRARAYSENSIGVSRSSQKFCLLASL